MSRIGKQPITIPKGVTVKLTEGSVEAKGPKGVSSLALHPQVKVVQEQNTLQVRVLQSETKKGKALWGLYRALLNNLSKGVSEAFVKKLEMVGVGYRAALQGNKLTLEVGFSHPVEMTIPEGVSCSIEKNVITLTGVDKQRVGQFAAVLRALRKPEPYKGKGIKYVGEVVRRKAGKAAKAAGVK